MAMLSYDMSKRGSAALYEYLYRCIRDDIVSGAIAAGERLPSKRALAHQVGVSVVTVESAYAQLVAEGYVTSRPRSGFFAAQLPRALRPSRDGGAQDWQGAFLPPAGCAQAPDLGGCAPGSGCSTAAPLADFSRPATSKSSPAAALWQRALRDSLAHEPEDVLFGSLPGKGSLRLREAVARHLLQSRGMDVDPGRIVVGAGAQVLYVLVAQLLARATPHPVFAVEDPGYPALARVYGACGAQVRFVPLDGEGMDVHRLGQSGADVAHVMPSHQFPTGRVTTIARRYELLGWAAQRPGRYIVEDDYDRDFRLSGRPIPPLAGIDAQGSVIYVSTFSKSLSPALRMAYLVLPPRLADAFDDELGFYANTVGAIDQVTLARLFESGAYERHLSRYRKRQRDVRDALVAAIGESALGPFARIEEADSGLHFVLALDVGADEGEIASRAAEGGVLLAPLSRYLHDCANAPAADGSARFVMQYEGLDVGNLPGIVRVLEGACGCLPA